MDPQVTEVTPGANTTHPFWQHFSKRTLLLIVGLLVVTGGLLFLAIRQQQPTRNTVIVPAPTPNPARTILSLVEQAGSSSATKSVAVMIQSNQNKVTGIQLNLSYDPKVLTNVSIAPGDYIPNVTVLLKNIDTVNGRITYVFAIAPTQKEVTGSGVAAIITYSLLPTTQTTTVISFLPKTEVTEQGVLGTVLKSTTDLTLHIPQSLQVVPTSTSNSLSSHTAGY